MLDYKTGAHEAADWRRFWTGSGNAIAGN